MHTNLLNHSPVFWLISIPLHCELDEMNAFITAGKEETSPCSDSSHLSTQAASCQGVSWLHLGTLAGLPQPLGVALMFFYIPDALSLA